MRHFRNYTISEETTRDFFDALRWRSAVDAATKADTKIPRSLRSTSDYNATRKKLAHIWGINFKPISRVEIKEIFSALVSDGWIEQNKKEDKFDDEKYIVTDKGNQLSVKSLVPRIDREKANGLVGDMIKRIEQINHDPSLLDYVTRVVVFGSYITDTNDLGDIDLCVSIVRRIDDYKEHTRARKAFNEASGKRFSTYLDTLFYHQNVVKQRIKNRSPYISLHDESDLELAAVTRTIYEFSPPVDKPDTSNHADE